MFVTGDEIFRLCAYCCGKYRCIVEMQEFSPLFHMVNGRIYHDFRRGVGQECV